MRPAAAITPTSSANVGNRSPSAWTISAKASIKRRSCRKDQFCPEAYGLCPAQRLRYAGVMAGLVWKLRWESDLSRAEHNALAALLSRIYPDHHSTFEDGRSWAGARPEGRVIGYSDGRPIAHLGFLRRMLRFNEDSSLLVGDVGLVGVDPSLHGSGIGLRLLEQASTCFHDLALPFGFLTCRPSIVPFYERGGWKKLPGQMTRMIDNNLQPETYTGPALALPVLAPMSEWPSDHTVIRDGLEV